ncbi:hypothetical protein Vadar_031980 [Vaccinium darrowii]|uniref:Uncharacterized protein n=1 Tax=Vaccinium darrowii TaxID=229202 RepID=A0ACB7Z8E5_9ERIC|nr:hypothetical protein Vadar_031980 [Vaccinium darrowii]
MLTMKRRQIVMEMEKEARVKTDRRGDGVVGEGLEAVEKDLMVETEEFFDAVSATQQRDDQGLVPPRATDPGWAHGVMVNGGRQKIKCKYCHKVILGGGISRLKQHLAGERGNVTACEEVPEGIKVQFQQHLGFKVLEKMKRQKRFRSGKSSSVHFDNPKGENDVKRKRPMVASRRTERRAKEVDEGISNRVKKDKKHLSRTIIPVAEPPIQSLSSQECVDKADMAIVKFMFDAGIPLSTSNSSYFQQMADAIAAAGPGYKVPSYHYLRGTLENRSVQEAEELSREWRKSCEMTGCTVMVDRWADRTGRVVINFFGYCSKGTIFLKSVVATDIDKSSEALLSLFDSVVQEVGPNNIVNFVTDTQPSYKAAGKELMSKYRTFFWSASAASCIDLMLEEIEKMDEVKEVMVKAKRITQFVYNNSWVFDLMRKKTGERDIIQLGITKYASNFLTLQTIVSLKGPLHQMFTSDTWMQSSFSKQSAGLLVGDIVMDPSFWSFSDQTLKAAKPLLAVLDLLDGHVKFYEDADGDFGRPMALRGRESLAPATWWSLYASDYSDLQRLAVRVLTQTCSIPRCKRSWSIFERMHIKKKNRLDCQRLDDFVFVHYNLRLQERQDASKTMTRDEYDPLCLEAIDVDMDDWVEAPAGVGHEDCTWMDLTILCETTTASPKPLRIDACDDSMDEKCSDDRKCIDVNRDT